MDRQQRIDALRKALASLDTAIAQTRAALRTSADPDEIQRLTSQLADLQAERQSVQFQLSNLEMATGEIADISPDNAAKVRALSADLDRAIVTGATVSATLDFANTVLAKASEMRSALA
jgi:chromosome segregation ATPase